MVSCFLLYLVRGQTGDVFSGLNTQEQTHICPWSNSRLPMSEHHDHARLPVIKPNFTFARDQAGGGLSWPNYHKQNRTLPTCYAMHAHVYLSFHFARKGSTVTESTASSGCCCGCGYRDMRCSCQATLTFLPFLCSYFWLFSYFVLSVRWGDAGDDCV